MVNVGGRQILTPTPGATVTITIDIKVPHTIAAWTSGEAESIVISGTPNDGQLLTMVITNDATLGRLLTLSTGLLGLGTVLNVINKKTILNFISYGGTFHEISRTIGI
jgi:hypothetical protein